MVADMISKNVDVQGMNTEPHTFPFDMTCRSPERWTILEQSSQRATEELDSNQY
jgi:hypothetical protein